MATGSLQVNRDIILATKKQYFKEQVTHTPVDAVVALASMQKRPRGILNFSNDGEKVTVFAQVTRHEIYDPITSALHCLANGADAIALFTDHSIYHSDLDDLLMLARAVPHVPVLFQNYMMNEYAVMSARAWDASAVFFYSDLVQPIDVRKMVSMAQRWKMNTIVQVANKDHLDHALTLSPHVLAFGRSLEDDLEDTVASLDDIRSTLPFFVKVMLAKTLNSVEEVALAVKAKVDAIIVNEDVLRHERHAATVRQLVAEVEAERADALRA
ncbi:MAG: hypothetical protein AAFR81_24545 [Chloroflexota bacterium]